MKKILDSVLDNKRLTKDNAIELFLNTTWTEMVQAAHQKRVQLNGEKYASYTVFKTLNYTNICKINCNYCGFKYSEDSKDAFVLSLQEIEEIAKDCKANNINQVLFQGGVNPNLTLDYYLECLNIFNKKYNLHVRGFSPVEFIEFAKKIFNIKISDLINKFKTAGLGSVPGSSAEIMTPEMRKFLSPHKPSAQLWCETMKNIADANLQSSSSMIIGSNETVTDIVQHLDYIRTLQDKTGHINSFILWTWQKQTNFPVRHVSGVEYLKTLAFCRLYLDNIKHIEVSVLGLGKEIGEIALNCGADDISSVVINEQVLNSKGLTTIQESEELIKQAGYIPLLRDFNYKKKESP